MQCAVCHRAWRPWTRRRARSSPMSARGRPIQRRWPHCPMRRRRSTPRRTPPELPQVASTNLRSVGYRPPLQHFAGKQICNRDSCSDIRQRNKAGRPRREAAGSPTLPRATRWQMRRKAFAHNPAFRLHGFPIDSKGSKGGGRSTTFGGVWRSWKSAKTADYIFRVFDGLPA
jgi:hypothetical protein